MFKGTTKKNSISGIGNYHRSGPRFLASAFAAGAALIIIVLEMIRNFTDYNKLFFGMNGKNALVPWIYTEPALNIVATAI